MLVNVKTRLRAMLPARVFFPMRRLWHRIARTPHVALAERFARLAGTTVRAGPFAGLRYVDVGSGSALIPKLVGSYEMELHDTLRSLTTRRYRKVVNVGCGEGFYAVGLARLLPDASVLASDSAPSARALCERLAAANGVADRVVVVGASTAELLDDHCGPETLLVMDCEGCERELTDPALVPNLRVTDLIVELHPQAWPEAARETMRRFDESHDIVLIESRPRIASEFPALAVLAPEERALALAERDGPQQWAVCWSRSGDHEV